MGTFGEDLVIIHCQFSLARRLRSNKNGRGKYVIICLVLIVYIVHRDGGKGSYFYAELAVQVLGHPKATMVRPWFYTEYTKTQTIFTDGLLPHLNPDRQ